MSDNRITRTERLDRSADSSADQAGENLREQALKLYQCPGNGGIVTNPADCRPMNGYQLPNVTLES